MKPIVETELSEIRRQEDLLKAKDAQLQSLGLSLTEEKIKNVQKDAMIQSLGQQLSQVKIDVALLKGAVGQ